MKLIAAYLLFLLNIFAFCANAQNNTLLLVNSEKADTVTFKIGDKVVVRTSISKVSLYGMLNEIKDSSLLIDYKRIPLSSIQEIRERNSTGTVIVKVVGGTMAALGLLTTYVIAATRPIPTDDPHHQQEYENDMEDYREALIVSGTLTVFAASTLFIHSPKYKFKKGWRAYIYSPVETPKIDSTFAMHGTDSTKTVVGESQLKDGAIANPIHQEISNNAAYLQFSSEISYSLFYDHLWKINNKIGISTSAGIAKEKNSDDFNIPISFGCVIGKNKHHLEIGQMSWIPFDDSSPDLLGVIAYRFQSFKEQIFIRGGIQIIEASRYTPDNRISPFVSIGIGF